ncbi:MAG: hypothetical protein KGH91_03565 [Rhodospirillales bacterium]|nr:hypothetical protein [Rhodospirillales bacterium]
MTKKSKAPRKALAQKELFNGGKPFWPAESNLKAMLGTYLFYEHMQIDRYRRLYNLTQNPLWVWTTIHFCSLPPRDRIKNWEPWDSEADRRLIDILEEAEDDPESQNYDEGMIARRDSFRAVISELPYPIPMPKWCQEYLGKCAAVFVEQSIDEKTSAKDAVRNVPEILGFSRMGWNAFAEDRKENSRQWMYLRFEELVYNDGLSKAEARKMLLNEAGLEDERNLQRILSYYTGLYSNNED